MGMTIFSVVLTVQLLLLLAITWLVLRVDAFLDKVRCIYKPSGYLIVAYSKDGLGVAFDVFRDRLVIRRKGARETRVWFPSFIPRLLFRRAIKRLNAEYKKIWDSCWVHQPNPAPIVVSEKRLDEK
jgi:hypothetical protein